MPEIQPKGLSILHSEEGFPGGLILDLQEMTEVAQERGKSSLPDEPATSGNEAKQVARAFVQFGRLGKFTRLARSSVRDASGMPQRANGTPKKKSKEGPRQKPQRGQRRHRSSKQASSSRSTEDADSFSTGSKQPLYPGVAQHEKQETSCRRKGQGTNGRAEQFAAEAPGWERRRRRLADLISMSLGPKAQ